VARSLRFLGNFYATMTDCRCEAAAATGDDGWLALGDGHARLVRRDELSAERAIRQADERNNVGDADLARMLQYVELLGLPRDQVMTIVRGGEETEMAGLGYMLDLLQLDRRTDRILPNGYCLLPPVRSCDKENACHGCGRFATGRSHLPGIRRQLAATEQLIRDRQAQHQGRYGEPMSDSNIWLEQRPAEIRSMRLEISALEALGDDTAIVRGPGVCGRVGYQDTGPAAIAITSKPETP
jgi:hypothetical protein